MEFRVGGSVIRLLQGDITSMETGAIVNAANPGLMGGGGVDGAIHRAGGPAIKDECREIIRKIGVCRTGQAVITTGGDLPAGRVIHTVGPIWRGGNEGEPEQLASAYVNSLKLALEEGLNSVAFPSISTGAYRYPVEAAAETALEAVSGLMRETDTALEVSFVLFDKMTFEAYASVAGKVLIGGAG